ncbi:filamentous hemagglutinin N-terminal domain-containing protein [Capilliphycus salinus ALCB114379]|uniref:two-partner secretion domain-containing protein n=1 Tax=Capilliphycus salinus TaxID=2768948 RepID=UPI0039A56D02
MRLTLFMLLGKAGFVSAILLLLKLPVQGQVIPDRTLGNENSVVVPDQNIRGIPSERIDGGAVRGSNLFHSFQEFNVDEGRGVYFSNPDNIVNILTRVTGGNISQILGTLGVLGNANLFLINPNGIVFGPNARLDVGGSFFATTADGILFENGFEFAASNPESPPLLTINMPLGLNIRENPGTIVNKASITNSQGNITGLEVPKGNSLLLVGGDIIIDGGGLNAPEGRIELAGLSTPGTFGLAVENNNINLNVPENSNFSNINLNNDARVSVLGTGGGDIIVNANNFTATNGGRLVAGTEGEGNGGNIIVNANKLEILGTGELDFGSGFYNSATPESLGNAGNILINTRSFRATSGATVNSVTGGLGNAGNIDLISTEFVELSEGYIESLALESSTGNAGNISIATGIYQSFGANGYLWSGTVNGGKNAGNIVINADSVRLLNQSSIDSSNRFASGNAGTVEINARNDINVSGESFIDAQSSGSGNGGKVTLRAGDLIRFDNGDIFTSSVIDSSGKAGDIDIKASSLSLTNNSRITAFASGGGNAGNITVSTRDFVALDNDSELSVSNYGSGAGGNVFMTTGQLFVRGGSTIVADVIEGNQPAGNLIINATETVDIAGSNEEIPGVFFRSRLSASNTANGNAGNLSIRTQKLTIRDGANVLAAALGNASAPGNISIQATESVEIFGTTPDQLSSSSIGAETIAEDRTTGVTANIIIKTGQLTIRDGSTIAAFTFGNSPGGTIEINASERVEVSGTRPISNFPSAIDTESNGTGKAGEIIITTNQFIVRDGGQVTASTSSEGQGGTLRVNAEFIELVGGVPAFPSQLETRTRGDGTGGTLLINARRLSVQEGARISTTTQGVGNAGNAVIDVSEVDIGGISTDGKTPSGIFADTTRGSAGDGGSVILSATNFLNVNNLGQITVSSAGTGAAGNLQVNSPFIQLDNQASFRAETAAGDRGNITLNTSDLRLRNNSNITTNATGVATGGNIEINTDNLIAIEDSDISANAQQAFGGQVIINANAIFGTQFRTQQSGASDITATSELGPEFSGTVELNTEIDPSSGLIELDANVVDPNALIAQNFCEQGKDSQFIVTGRGGLPPNPRDLQSVNLSRVGLIETVPNNSPQNSTINNQNYTLSRQPFFDHSQSSNNKEPVTSENIIPARGWIRNEKGEVILVSYDPTKTGVRRQPYNFNNCQPQLP